MAAFRQLLLRGLLAGRRVAMAPTQARPAFSTTTTTAGGGSHSPQIHQLSFEQAARKAMREVQRDAYGRGAAVTVLLSIGAYAGSDLFAPRPPSKSFMREFKS